MFNPVLVNTIDNIKVAITESDLDDYPGMFLKGSSSNSLQSAFAPYPIEERIAEGDYPEMVVANVLIILPKQTVQEIFHGVYC